MSQTSSTILVTTDRAVSESIASALGDDPLLTPFMVCETMRQLEKQLDKAPSGLVLVDIEPQPEVMLEYVGQLVDARPQSRFVVIAPEFDKQLLLESMQAGARHFLPKAWIGPDMIPICRDLAEQIRGSSATRGRVFTVLSASGGCGATTVAVNLAAEMGALAGRRSLVVDFDVRFGGAGTHLGLRGEYGVADLLAREAGLDIELVHSTAIGRGDWLEVLLSPASVNFAEPAPLYLDQIEEVYSVFKSGYPATVIDAPALPLDATGALASISTATLIVMQLSVKDLHNARLMLGALAKADVRTPVHVIANRCKGAGKPITLKEAADTLEFDGQIIPLPDEPVSASRGLYAGEPLVKAAGGSKLRKQFVSLARQLSGDDDAGETKKQPKPSLFKRKRAA
jgi:pilus assembly protein CpaE